MEIKRFTVHNDTRETEVASAIRIVDAVLEPLKVLKVLIEGLTPDAGNGLWLTHFKGVPVARTFSPFDLIYLDKDYGVVHAVALTTDSDFAPFKGMPASALVLPSGSIASSKTRHGDHLIISLDNATASEAPRMAIPNLPPQVTQAGRSLRDLSAGSRFATTSYGAPTASAQNSPLENFLISHSPATGPRGSAARSAPLPSAPPPAPSASSSDVLSTQAQNGSATAPPPVPGSVSNGAPANAARSTRVARSGSSRIPKRQSPVRINSAPAPATPAPPEVRLQEVVPFATPPPTPPPAPATASAQLRTRVDEALAAAQIQPRPSELPSLPQSPIPMPDRRAVVQPAPRIIQPPPSPPTQPRIVQPRPPVAPPQRSIQPRALPANPPRPPGPDILAPRKRPEPGAPAPFTDYQGIEIATGQEEKTSKAKRFLRWAFPELPIFQPPPKPQDRRRAGRLDTPGLIAYFFTGGAPKPHQIENISVTGFYMNTTERWIPGTIIRMTLQRTGTVGFDPLDSITVHSRVIRWGRDGGGFEFVLSGFLD